MIGAVYSPTAPRTNTENIGLEVVWPFGLIGTVRRSDGAGEAHVYPSQLRQHSGLDL